MSTLLIDLSFSNLESLPPWNLKVKAEQNSKHVNSLGMKQAWSETLARLYLPDLSVLLQLLSEKFYCVHLENKTLSNSIQ